MPLFRSIKVEVRVETPETRERLMKVVEETGACCPIYDLVRDAGVRIEMIWIGGQATG